MKFLVLSLVIAAQAPAAVTDSIVGLWRTDPTETGYAHIEVTREGQVYEGRVVWLSQPYFPAGDPEAGQPKVDRLNPDPELRGQPIIGLPLMTGFRYADGVWKGGRIYDPETGNTYKSVLRLSEDGKLKVRGYIGISLLGRTTVWERVDL